MQIKRTSIFIVSLLFPVVFAWAQQGDTPPLSEEPSSTTVEAPVQSTPVETPGTGENGGVSPQNSSSESEAVSTGTTAARTTSAQGETVQPPNEDSGDTTSTPEALSTSTASSTLLTANENVFGGLGTYVPVLTAGIVALVVGGYIVSQNVWKKKGDEKSTDRCSALKHLLEQKKKELAALESRFSAHKAFLEKLKEKIQETKNEVTGKVHEKLKNKILGDEKSALGKVVNKGEEVKEKYADIQERYKEAKKLLEVLKNKKVRLETEVKSLESSYAACVNEGAEVSVVKKEEKMDFPAVNLSAPKRLFADKEIFIDAPAQRVWEVLTKRAYSDVWAKEFSGGSSNDSGRVSPTFYIESNWKLGALVLWKVKSGRVVVEGTVTALRPYALLRFTVFDVREDERRAVEKDDGITYELSEKDGQTKLHVFQGDFSKMEEGEKYHRLSEEVWGRVLPIVKRFAETPKQTVS